MTTRTIEPMIDDTVRMTASRAQCMMFDTMVAIASILAGHFNLAAGTLRHRPECLHDGRAVLRRTNPTTATVDRNQAQPARQCAFARRRTTG